MYSIRARSGRRLNKYTAIFERLEDPIVVKLATTKASTTDLGRVEIFNNNTSEGRICVRVLWYVFLSTLTQIPPPEIVTVRIQSSSKSVVLALRVASFTSISVVEKIALFDICRNIIENSACIGPS